MGWDGMEGVYRSCFSETEVCFAFVRFLASPPVAAPAAAAGDDAVVAEDAPLEVFCFSCWWISSNLLSDSTSCCFFPGQRLAKAPHTAINVRVHTICQTVLLIAPLGALGNAKNHPNGPNQLCSPGGNQKIGVFEYQLVTQKGMIVVITNITPLNSIEKVERALARSELVFSRSASPLSTLRRNLAHFAN